MTNGQKLLLSGLLVLALGVSGVWLYRQLHPVARAVKTMAEMQAATDAVKAPPGAPAFDTYRQAWRAMPKDAADPTELTTLASRDAYRAEHAEALRLVRIGLSQAYQEPYLNTNEAMPLFPEWTHYRSFAGCWWLMPTAMPRTADSPRRWTVLVTPSRWAARSARRRRGGHVGRHLDPNIGQKALRELWPKLDPKARQHALCRLPADFARQAEPADLVPVVVRKTKDLVGVCWAPSLSRAERIKALDDLLEDYSPAQRRMVTRRHVELSLADYPPLLAAALAKPFGAEPLLAPPADALVAYSFANLRLLWASWTVVQAKQQVLLASLARQSWHADRGGYPATLDELVPEYLATVPTDPFGDRPLTYRRTADGYQLYSLGPNRVDDGGQKHQQPKDLNGPDDFLTAPGDIVE